MPKFETSTAAKGYDDYKSFAQANPYVAWQEAGCRELLAGRGRWVAKHAEILRLTGPLRAARVLDLGCSVGAHALHYAKLGNETYGVDFLEEMVAAGNRLAAEFNLPNCRIVRGDVTRLEELWEAGFFDCVIASDICEHLSDEDNLQALRGARQVLRTGGRIVVHTAPSRYYYWFSPRHPKYLTLFLLLAWLPTGLFERAVRGVDRWIVRGLLRRGYEDLLHEPMHINCMDPRHLEGLMRQAGFRDVRTYARTVDAEAARNEGVLTGVTRFWFARHAITARNVYGTGVK